MKRTLALLIFIFASILTSNAQKIAVDFDVQETKIQKLGTTIPLRESVSKLPTSRQKKLSYKSKKTAPENFKGRGFSKVVHPHLEHQGPDPIRQKIMGTVQVNDPLVNIDGLSNNFGSPHDPTGDIGTSHYVQAINGTMIGIFAKSGSLVSSFSANTLWTQFNKNGEGDPIILFDEMANRWFITEFADPADLLIAISDTDDPTGSYTVYNFSTPEFPDYPKYAIWPNALVVTTNEGGGGILHNYFIDRAALLNGADNVTMQRIAIDGNNSTEAGFFVSTPLDFSGSMMPIDGRPMVMRLNDSSWGATSNDAIELYAFNIDWSDINNTSVEQSTLITTPYDGYPCSETGFGFQCVPQLDGGGLDAIPEVIMNIPMYRRFANHESIVLSFITDATDGENQSAIRWMELRKTQDNPWGIYQEGTYAPDGLDRYMSSIGIDINGNIALAYNVSSPDTYVGIRYTGRFASDPLGMMTIEEVTVVDGINRISSGGRFGDYAQMGLDPIDNTTFWYTSEYGGNGTSNSKTRIVAFQLQKSNYDARPLSFIAPLSSANLTDSESITVEYQNTGINEISNLKIGLIYNGMTLEEFIIPEVLSEGERYTHTFATKIDMSNIGAYEISSYTSFDQDEVTANDIITTTINHYPDSDASISGITTLFTCNSNKALPFAVKNESPTTITSLKIGLKINGESKSDQNYAGPILFGQSKEFMIPIADLVEGVNTVEITIIEVNGGADNVPSNNTLTTLVTFESGFEEYLLVLNTDEYPEETTWSLSDQESGEILYLSDEYTVELTEERSTFCLEAGKCYLFEIFDSAGDGICCIFGSGNYQILDGSGMLIIDGSGNFDNSQAHEICPSNPCNLVVNTQVTDASSSGSADGAILVEVDGGNMYTYSLNGGDPQEDPLFDNLLPGTYSILISSNGGVCLTEIEVVIGIMVASQEEHISYHIIASPNPSEGLFHVSLSGLTNSGYHLKMQIFDQRGSFMHSMPLHKYNDVYQGDISLVNFPSGTYYVKIVDPSIRKLVRLIKL